MSDWRKVHTVSNEIEAQILKSYLESCKINAQLKSEAIGQIHGLTAGPLAEVEVWVPSGQFSEAIALVEEFVSNGSKDNSD